MKLFTTLTAIFIGILSFAQNERTLDLYIAFDLSITLTEETSYSTTINAAIPEFQSIQSQYNFTLQKGITLSEEKLDYLEQQGLKISGDNTAARQLRNLLKINIENVTDAQIESLASALEELNGVTYVAIESRIPVQPPYDIPPTTDDYEPLQGYLGPDPGVNMLHAWSLGLIGDGINIRDVEYGMNVDHEDLNEMNVLIQPGMTVHGSLGPDWTEHGTATAGVVFADRGGYGVSGMAYGANEFILFPEYTEELGYNRTYAVQQSIANSVTGDFIIYEMQTGGQNGNYVPAEYSLPIWNLTKAATDAGIVIVAAAGNGNENLDDPFYQSYLNRGDSGAIIVGAGTPNTGHHKLNFSTYGSRVNVQGWGLNVLSSGYGDYAQWGGDFNQNYTMFSGTSSATPIVSSCAIVLQSYYHDLTGNYLTSQQLRQALIDTGIPQGSGGHIGPLPNMVDALAYVATIGIEDLDVDQLVLFPNPAQNEITIYANNSISSSAQIEIHNALGQLIYKNGFVNSGKIDISGFQSGVYFVKVIADNNQSFTKKLIKK